MCHYYISTVYFSIFFTHHDLRERGWFSPCDLRQVDIKRCQLSLWSTPVCHKPKGTVDEVDTSVTSGRSVKMRDLTFRKMENRYPQNQQQNQPVKISDLRWLKLDAVDDSWDEIWWNQRAMWPTWKSEKICGSLLAAWGSLPLGMGTKQRKNIHEDNTKI